MVYHKPELTELGPALVLIQGSKIGIPDAGATLVPGTSEDLEFND